MAYICGQKERVPPPVSETFSHNPAVVGRTTHCRGVVIVPAVLFAISGVTDLKTRVENFSSGAVLAGWLGTLIGAIMILGNIDFNTWQESLPPASAIMLLTVLYGYTAKAVCFLIAENLPE